MKRAAVAVVTACVLAPVVLVGVVAVALSAGAPTFSPGSISSVDGVDPAVLAIVSRSTALVLSTHPGCDADPILVLAHMSIEWSPGLRGLGRNNTPMAANGDFYPIVQAYAPVPGADADGGEYDGSATAEYAVGPLQQINAFRKSYAIDGNYDGVITQNNLADAAAISVVHACVSRQSSDLSLTTPEGRRYEAGSYMLPSAPLSDFTADYRNLVEAAYERLRASAKVIGGARLAGRHAFPVDPSLITNQEVLLAPHHDYPAWDFPVATGTTVYAAAGGTVVAAGFTEDCGNGVTIDADDGGRYTYCHGIALLVATGAEVSTGDPILLSGSTGKSTGPHLHIQIRYEGSLICPQSLLAPWFEGIDADPPAALTNGCAT